MRIQPSAAIMQRTEGIEALLHEMNDKLDERQAEQIRVAVQTVANAAEEALKGEDALNEPEQWLQDLANQVEWATQNPNNSMARALLAGGIMKRLLLLQYRLSWLAQAGEYSDPNQQMLYDTTLLTLIMHKTDPTSPDAEIDADSLRSVFSAVRARPPPPPRTRSPLAHAATRTRALFRRPLAVAHAPTPTAPPPRARRRCSRRTSTATCAS